MSVFYTLRKFKKAIFCNSMRKINIFGAIFSVKIVHYLTSMRNR